jgi:hypothetical protein
MESRGSLYQEHIKQGVKFTTHLHLMHRLKMSGATPSLLHIPSQYRQGLYTVPSNSTEYCMLQYMMESHALIWNQYD